jgi:hypothetical protein
VIYYRKAETVRAIQIEDYSQATVAAVKEFTGSEMVEHRKYIRAGQDTIQVAIRGVHGYINLYRGDWLVQSDLTGWCKYMDYEFRKRFEEGEHGQQSGDGVAKGL